uniref:HTH CENPB-type domain-containing protein n=1 Tax=Syphacia muris TaxID=451379 RepID=A0A0N5AP39_9BILA
MADATNDNGRRRKRALSSDERPTQKGRKLKQYVLEEKLDIIDYAKVIGNRAAGREFNVAESSIREWRKNEQRLRAMLETASERSRIDSTQRRPLSEDLEKALVYNLQLLHIASQSEVPLTWNAIKEKANDIWNKICEKDNDIKGRNFAANMGWIARFIKRNNIQIMLPNDTEAGEIGADTSSCKKPSVPVSTVSTLQLDSSRVSDAVKPLNSSESVSEQVSSKRKRKNFIPKKMVEKNCAIASNILLETLAEKNIDSTNV